MIRSHPSARFPRTLSLQSPAETMNRTPPPARILPRCLRAECLFVGLLLVLSGCSQPIGLTRVSPEESYQTAITSPLTASGELSNDAKSVLHRYNLTEAYDTKPADAIRALHQVALKDERRDLLFALAELSYAYGGTLPERALATGADLRAQDVFLQSSVYAYLYLLGKGSEPPPSAYDGRFRQACEFYNRALDHAFRAGKGDGLQFVSGRRNLGVTTLPVSLVSQDLGWKLADFDSFVAADSYDVFGFTVRNRTPGLGLPAIGVTRKSAEAPNGGALPITAFLRVNGDLADIQNGRGSASLELYSAYDDNQVTVNGQPVPLQSDATAPLAYRLNDPELWNVGLKRFITGEQVPNHMLLIQPYEPGRIPVVLVHGTGSSPVWWAEMVNTLRNDPVMRKRYQFWFYQYTSNSVVLASAADLRETLTTMVNRLDPQHKDPALNQMVVIGHSQGGLLTNLTAVDPGDQLFRSISDVPFESLQADPMLKKGLARSMFFRHLPFVKRIVYISTPHRGSFLTKDWVRNLARNVLTLPADLILGGAEKFAQLSGQLKLPPGMREKIPTSIDGMAANNPVLQTLAKLPLAPGITAHSIIAVLPDQDIKTGNDGVVEYSSAHVDGVASEYIVRTGHSAQGHPLAIEEVRRILYTHLGQQQQAAKMARAPVCSAVDCGGTAATPTQQ